MTEKVAPWWAVALSEEITANEPEGRRCRDEEIVLFRDLQGRVQALEDRCAHRRAPLSLGRMTEEGFIQCGYHGWTYDGASGRCVAIPNLSRDERVPPRYGVRKYEALERDGFVYVRTGIANDEQDPEPPAAGLTEQSNHGAILIALSHETFTGVLLDGPWVVVDLGDITILPDHRLGDPFQTDYGITADFAAEWTRTLQGQKGGLADNSFMVRISIAPVTAMASIQLMTTAEDTLLEARLASLPVHANVSEVRWRYALTPLGSQVLSTPHCAIAERPAPSQLLKVRDFGIKQWRALNATAAISQSPV